MSAKITKAVFPAAGFGTRFLPVTKALPKEMLPIVDTPVIQLLVEEAVASGIEEIVVVTGRGKRAIEDHFDVAFELEKTLLESGKQNLLKEVERISSLARFVYIRQPVPRGDGDAVLRAKGLIDEPFAVFFSDDLVDHETPLLAQMLAAYERRPGCYLAVEEVPDDRVSQYGILESDEADGRTLMISRLLEKPQPEETASRWGITGRYIVTPEIFDALERARNAVTGELRLIDALRLLHEEGFPVYGYRFEGTRFDTGSKLGFLRATVHYALKHPELAAPFREYLRTL